MSGKHAPQNDVDAIAKSVVAGDRVAPVEHQNPVAGVHTDDPYGGTGDGLHEAQRT